MLREYDVISCSSVPMFTLTVTVAVDFTVTFVHNDLTLFLIEML
jgi:hypothetical protein